MPTRGFQSSVDPRLHFGLGSTEQIDSLTVIWPDRRQQVLTHVAVDRALTLSQQDASGARGGAGATAGAPRAARAAAPAPPPPVSHVDHPPRLALSPPGNPLFAL